MYFKYVAPSFKLVLTGEVINNNSYMLQKRSLDNLNMENG